MKFLVILVALAVPASSEKPTVYEQNFICCKVCIDQGADFGFMVKEDTCGCFKREFKGEGQKL